MSSDEVELDPALGAKVSPAGSVAGVAGSEAATAAGAVEGVAPNMSAEIAAALASGRVDPARAQELLIDQIAREQLPAGASAEDLAALRGELQTLLGGDPTLARLLRS